MTAHVHAELMAQYAEDARETDKPWERWEYCIGSEWFQCREAHMHWSVEHQYRRKPRTININGYEVPEPMREAPDDGTWVWVASPGHPDGVNHYRVSRYMGFDTADRWAALGLMHTTREAAEAHAKALLSFTQREKADG